MSEKPEENSVGLERLKKAVLFPEVKFAMWGLVFMLIMGVFYREFSRPFFGDLSVEEQVFAGYMLSLAHGHSFALFFLIPIGLAFATYLVGDKLSEESIEKIAKLFKIYAIAAIGTYALLFYKGVWWVTQYEPGAGIGLTEVDESLYGGSVALRSIVYAAFHTTFGVISIWYAVKLSKHMK